MKLRLAALVLGVVSGFTVSWARMTDPHTFHAMLALAVAAGVLVGVKLQPALARAAERMSRGPDSPIPVVQGADVL